MAKEENQKITFANKKRITTMITEKKEVEKNMIIGREGAQSQKINDPSVSRAHLEMTLSGKKEKPYHIRCLKTAQTLYVNGNCVLESDICDKDEVLLGPNRHLLNVKQAIEDFHFQMEQGIVPPSPPTPPSPSEEVTTEHLNRLKQLYTEYAQKKKEMSRMAALMQISGVATIILFTLSRILKPENGNSNQLLILTLLAVVLIAAFGVWYVTSWKPKKESEMLTFISHHMNPGYICYRTNKTLKKNQRDYIEVQHLKNGINCQECVLNNTCQKKTKEKI